MGIASHSKINQLWELQFLLIVFSHPKTHCVSSFFTLRQGHDKSKKSCDISHLSLFVCLAFVFPIDHDNPHEIAREKPILWVDIQNSKFFLLGGQNIIIVVKICLNSNWTIFFARNFRWVLLMLKSKSYICGFFYHVGDLWITKVVKGDQEWLFLLSSNCCMVSRSCEFMQVVICVQ